MEIVGRDRITRAVASDAAVRVISVDATGPARHAIAVHGLKGDAARIAAESVVAAALLSAHVKGDDRIAVQIQASDPELAAYAEARGDGGVRARLTPPAVHAPDGRLTGFLLAIHSDAGGEVYRGTTEILDQTVEDALADHLRRSEQVDHALRIAVAMEAGACRAAVGLLVERLPGSEETSLDELFGDVARAAPEELAAGSALLGRPLDVLETRALVWRCTCSREKVERMLTALGREELDDMIARDHGAEVTCHFCNQVFAFDEAGLSALVGRS